MDKMAEVNSWICEAVIGVSISDGLRGFTVEILNS
jgi:hypothetical protein